MSYSPTSPEESLPSPSDPDPAVAAPPLDTGSRQWLLWALPPLILLAAAWAITQAYLPEGRRYYEPSENGLELRVKERLEHWRKQWEASQGGEGG